MAPNTPAPEVYQLHVPSADRERLERLVRGVRIAQEIQAERIDRAIDQLKERLNAAIDEPL